MERETKTGYLDGLRGLAALIVVFHHYAAGFFPSVIFGTIALEHTHLEHYVYGTPLDLFFAGNFAVCIFFVLSGFVLSYKFFHESNRDDALFSSAMRRYGRLMPTVFGSVMIAYTLLHFGLFFNHQTGVTSGSTSWLATFWSMTANFGAAFREGILGTFMDGTATYNSSLWTMHYEFFGSFIVFGFLAICGRAPRRNLAYFLTALAFYNTYFLAFLGGIWLSDNKDWLRNHAGRFNIHMAPALLVVLGLTLGIMPIPSSRFSPVLPLYDSGSTMVVLHILGAFVLVFGLLNAPRLQGLLMKKPFQYLGRISFSLYVLHILVLGSLSSYLFSALITHHSYLISFIVMFIPSLIFIFILATFYTVWIDERAIRVSSALYRRFGRARATPDKGVV